MKVERKWKKKGKVDGKKIYLSIVQVCTVWGFYLDCLVERKKDLVGKYSPYKKMTVVEVCPEVLLAGK